MHFKVTLKIIGMLLMAFSASMIPSLLISLSLNDGAHWSFGYAFCITFIAGFLIWLPFSTHTKVLRTRDGFVIVVMFWTILGLFGALPFYFSTPLSALDPSWSYVDSLFESLSGLTTTGATVIVHLDDLPTSLLFYRQFLQWFGGMGIIVLAVAILPMLGIGGMQLYRAETPGPVKDSKLTPRITETAKQLWYIYLTLTVTCATAYWLAGMTLFDAITHSFSTVAIGGFSTHDASLGYFNSAAVETIAIIFMLLAAVNFSLHFQTARTIRNQHYKARLSHYWHDEEFRFFLSVIASICLITVGTLWLTNGMNFNDSFRQGVFEVVSIATTTGFATADFSQWPAMLAFLLFSAAFIGGCAGSTGGGMKVVRVLIVLKQGLREIRRLIHPNAIIHVKLGSSPIPDRVAEAVWGFFSVYTLVFFIMMIALLGTGMDQVTAWSAVGATLNNLGPGLGDVAQNYSDVTAVGKWILCFSMLLGRLEVFTLLVLFTPMFWRD
ncbi:MAG: potassium transporter [Oceanospirillaceae bacterium]|jgi:trk system potassium uptake protein TrkH|nr:potassium transporter [Oceanospirillaceae bacterium]MBT4444238.1 potassium transporter [Oceanospirillaceae bacterium]